MSAHRYWRIEGLAGFQLGGGNFFWNVSILQFFDKDYANLVTGGTPISSGVFGGFPASNAFDGNTGSVASLNANAANASTGECWIGYDFGSPVEVK